MEKMVNIDRLSEQKELSLFEYYKLSQRPNTLICYRGPISYDLLKAISRDINEKFSRSVSLKKKLFSIYIELVQNIFHYSSEKIKVSNRHDSVGTILLIDELDHYIFACGNLIENAYLQEILDHCKFINSLGREELRQYKRNKRNAPRQARSKGAGIGLIQVALTSGNAIKAEYKKIDEKHSYFTLVVKVSIKKKDKEPQ